MRERMRKISRTTEGVLMALAAGLLLVEAWFHLHEQPMGLALTVLGVLTGQRAVDVFKGVKSDCTGRAGG